MPVVGIVQAKAGGAGRQDRGIEGGGAKHQLPRRRATQLLVQLMQADGRAHRSPCSWVSSTTTRTSVLRAAKWRGHGFQRMGS